MPENPTPPPAPGPVKPRRERGALSQAQVDELNKAEQLCRTSRKEEYVTKLVEREIETSFLNRVELDIGQARKISADAVQATSGKTSSTAAETTAKNDLLEALQEIQAAAKQKYSRADKARLADYFVGQRLDANRPLLEQYSQAIIEKLGTDTLPGIKPAKVARLATLRQLYTGADAAQGDAQTEATGERAALDTLVQTITDRRVQIQYAADAEWSHKQKANAGIRRAFKLPPSKPFNG